MPVPSRRYVASLLSLCAIFGLCLLVPGSGTAELAFIEDWVLTQEAELRTIEGDCDPDETCLELCLFNPQTGVLIKQGVFECVPN